MENATSKDEHNSRHLNLVNVKTANANYPVDGTVSKQTTCYWIPRRKTREANLESPREKLIEKRKQERPIQGIVRIRHP
jgi:hypothetical protein